MSDEERLTHLQQTHGVMLTAREAQRFTVEDLDRLWEIHGPHVGCVSGFPEQGDDE